MISTGFGLTRNYNYFPDDGLEGMLDDSVPHDVVTLVNNATTKNKSAKITLGTPASSTQYRAIFSSTKLGFPRTEVVYTSDAAATPANLQSGFLNAIRSELNLASYLKLTTDGNDIVITSRGAGSTGDFNLSVSGGGTGYAASLLTAPADAPLIPFGRLLFQKPEDTARNCRVIDGPLASGVIRGFSVRTEVHESPYPGGLVGYLPMYEVNALTRGRMQIVPVSNMHPAGQIHVYIAGANQGRLCAAADGVSTVQYTGTGIRIYEPCAANEIGRVDVNLP